MISFGSVFSGMIAVILLSIYGYFFIARMKHPVYGDLRMLILLFLVAGARMLFPLNLPLNVTIKDETILVPASYAAFHEVPGTGLEVYQIVFLAVALVALILLVVKGVRYHAFRKSLLKLTEEDTRLSEIAGKCGVIRDISGISFRKTNAGISPMVFGVLRPVIVIPDGVYSDDELKYVLDHELTHIKQHDLLIKAAFDILTALFWWNPFVWMIRKQAGNAIEVSNDVSLYEEMSPEEKTDYAELLVKTAGLNRPGAPYYSLSMASHGDPLIRKRVEGLLSTPPSRRARNMLPVHVLVMVIILAASLIVTPEPYSIHEDQVGASFDMEDDLGATPENTYILDKGDYYELYVDGAFVAKMHHIPEEFSEYPVYTEKPNE